MTDQLTDEAVRAMLDGATPGPWRADGEPWNRVVWSSADNRVCFMAHSNGMDDERDIATSNLAAAAPDLARALLDASAELDRLRADAQAAVALVVEQAADRMDSVSFDPPDHWDAVTQHEFHEIIVAECLVWQRAIRALAPADGLAAVEALRKERDDLRECLKGADDRNLKLGQKLQDANAELAASQQREAALREALTPSGDTKAAYMGEIKDPDTKRMVSWTAIKMVMAMISARAALSNNGRGE